MSEIARSGFRNEDWIASEFNNWQNSDWASKWLSIMGYNHPRKICAQTTRKMGYFNKADILVLIDDNVEWLSAKKFTASFNQIDKRWVKKFAKIWKMPDEIIETLKMYCGEEGYRPVDCKANETTVHQHRFLLNEMSTDRQNNIVSFFNKNKKRIIRDVVAGTKRAAARWMLVVEDSNGIPKRSALLPIEVVIQHCVGHVYITERGNLRIGNITVQRKGGDSGKPTAQMLQFKFSPKQLFDLKDGRFCCKVG